ncbi:EthD domain-containing protein [Streptomyces shenzhenensis]|uniref:EthD domain-containing protein n=1 Tax=Streptomyces shenzhenensis TaxID=943815 RepID=UPI0028680F31|nr:EthD domain-containing protein [Streptomyces shenzhenensis]
MLTLIVAARRKPGMTHQAFLHHLHPVHGPLSAARPLRIPRYVQNHVFDASLGAEGDPSHLAEFGRDSVTELWLDDMEALAPRCPPRTCVRSSLPTAPGPTTRPVPWTC